MARRQSTIVMPVPRFALKFDSMSVDVAVSHSEEVAGSLMVKSRHPSIMDFFVLLPLMAAASPKVGNSCWLISFFGVLEPLLEKSIKSSLSVAILFGVLVVTTDPSMGS